MADKKFIEETRALRDEIGQQLDYIRSMPLNVPGGTEKAGANTPEKKTPENQNGHQGDVTAKEQEKTPQTSGEKKEEPKPKEKKPNPKIQNPKILVQEEDLSDLSSDEEVVCIYEENGKKEIMITTLKKLNLS